MKCQIYINLAQFEEMVYFCGKYTFIITQNSHQQILFRMYISNASISPKPQTPAKCPTCEPTKQHKLILRALLKKLSILISDQQLHLEHVHHAVDMGEKDGFIQLIRILGLDKWQLGQIKPICRHSHLKSRFRMQLKCSQKALNYICQIISEKLSERTYHFWLLSTQVKTITKTIYTIRVTAQHSKEQILKTGQEKNELEINSDKSQRQNSGRDSLPLTNSQQLGMYFYPTSHSMNNLGQMLQNNVIYYSYPYLFKNQP